MKVIILAAGYGTRLQRDIDGVEQYKHLVGLPKPLVPLNKKPLVNYWLSTLEKSSMRNVKYPDDVYIVVNDHFYGQFMDWCEKSSFPKSNVVNDGTRTNEDRLGAVADIQLAIDKYSLQDDDLMIIGGDTLFTSKFHTNDLDNILRRHFDPTRSDEKHPVILYYTLEDYVNISEKGILEIEQIDEESGVVTDFKEKPRPDETNSRLACPCFYLLDRSSVPLVKTFLDKSKSDRKATDATGNLVKYLTQSKRTIAYKIDQRFDVGHLQEYIVADQYFASNFF